MAVLDSPRKRAKRLDLLWVVTILAAHDTTFEEVTRTQFSGFNSISIDVPSYASRFADALGGEPRRFVGDVERALQLLDADRFVGRAKQVHSLQPLMKWKM